MLRDFLAGIEREVHAKRPALRFTDGAAMLGTLMQTISGDACQRCEPVPCRLYDGHEEREIAAGYVHDHESTKAQRLLLRHLEAVTRSARPSSDPGIPLGRERPATETSARACSKAVSSE